MPINNCYKCQQKKNFNRQHLSIREIDLIAVFFLNYNQIKVIKININ